ncbi:DPH4 homolog [Drosophila sulfurigaster albostrigata]|uniref:DPH4 homolog n=1 Tax=Drosophila sulfurigaster albostrigata TaxID=89887 RepID=UPI002D21C3ED|nr:DPH4 homolog [Drosophila sulfurigaster albostrigata]XP_062125320.1 DPH4 homolog [Drosophila sulfurigaster albostrigata]
MANVNFYKLLNVPTTATFEELKRNYKQLILQCHPDKIQQQKQSEESEVVTVTVNANENDPNRESDNSNFNAINKAWNTLKDPIKRKLYDAELLQTKFQTHINIYATITLSDMQRVQVMDDEEEERAETNKSDKETATLSFAYAYNCRCGGQYVLDDESAQQQHQVREGESEHLKASEMIVECSECSLMIIVKPVANKQYTADMTINV